MPNNLDLKYRPKTFKDLVGKTQRDMAKKVSRLIENGPRPQRILLYGPPGVGKTSAARIIQSCYMCEGGVSSQPCGDCIGCKGHPLNSFELNGGVHGGIEEMRHLLQIFDLSGRYIVIFDEADLITTASFAALRKPLEEPHSGLVFILCTNEFMKIPPQIRSRCLCFHLEKIGFDDRIELVQKVLAAEGASLGDTAINEIARQSDGQVRDLLNLLELELAA